MIRAVKRLVGLGILLLAAYAGFRWGGAVFPRVEALVGIEEAGEDPARPVPTPELAEATLERVQRFRRAQGGERLTLGGTEVTAVVRYGVPGLVPPGVSEPAVSFRDGKAEVEARVATEAFPRLPRLEAVIGMLPDTVVLRARGSLVPLDQRHLALVVDDVSASRVPLPQNLVAQVLEALRGPPRPGAPADAVEVPLPDGVTSAFVQRDSLVLLAAGG